MATTDYEIANLALSRIGVSDVIGGLGESSTEAKACNRWYAVARDELLQEVRWGFATKRLALTDLTATADTRADWGYAYDLPADFLTPQYIYIGVHDPRASQREPYLIEYDTTLAKRVLLTNDSSTTLIYTAKITTVTLFPPQFVRALSAKLAALICLELTGDERRAQFAEARAEREVARAIATEYREGQDGPAADADWIADR